MANLDGVYIIRPLLGENLSLVPSLVKPVFVPVLGREPFFGQPKWRVVPAGRPGSNLYTITLADQDHNHLIVLDDRLYVSFQGVPTQFSIEPAGNGEFRVHIPNENKVWTLRVAGEQVQTDPAVGAPGQRWRFERSDEN